MREKIIKIFTWHKSITILSWTFCHKWALKIWISEIFKVGILPCMKIPVKSSCTWKPTYTLALLIVGDHHKVNLRLGIWFKPDLWAFVNFLYFMDSSKPEAFSLKRTLDINNFLFVELTIQINRKSKKYLPEKTFPCGEVSSFE